MRTVRDLARHLFLHASEEHPRLRVSGVLFLTATGAALFCWLGWEECRHLAVALTVEHLVARLLEVTAEGNL